jgi:hypothetical protein
MLRCRHTIVAESRNKGIPHALYCIPRLRHQPPTKRLGPCSQLASYQTPHPPLNYPPHTQSCSLQSHVFSAVPFSLRHHARADTSWSRKHTSRTCRRMSGALKHNNGSCAKPNPSHHLPPPHRFNHSLPLHRHHHPWGTALTPALKSPRSRACVMSCREWKSSRTAAASLLTKRTTAEPPLMDARTQFFWS